MGLALVVEKSVCFVEFSISFHQAVHWKQSAVTVKYTPIYILIISTSSLTVYSYNSMFPHF